jgi:beta-glucosidase/6-phospho-beta-glucosidase/beta-galactosidase
MNEMGVSAYRFSLSWPRKFPNGTGGSNLKSLGFHSRLVRELKTISVRYALSLGPSSSCRTGMAFDDRARRR